VVEQGLQLPPAFATDYSHPSCPPDDLKGYDHSPDLNSEGSASAADAFGDAAACRVALRTVPARVVSRLRIPIHGVEVQSARP